MLLHEGGSQPRPDAINGCTGVSGPIVDIVDRLDPEVDLVVSGHTHQPYNCVIDGSPDDQRGSLRPARHRHRHDASTARTKDVIAAHGRTT